MRDRVSRIVLISTIVWLFVSSSWANDWIRVRWVDDGDTIVLVDGRRVRYIGIDAPEIANDRYAKKAEPLSYKALAFNRHLVHRKRVRLELDEETRDAYDRVLAYVFLPGERMVNTQMVVNGFAYFLPHRPNGRYDAQLLNAQRTAMQASRGIWRQWKQADMPVIGNRRSRRFHTESCPNSRRIGADNRIRFDNPWKAFWQGYAPARGCFK